MSPDEHAKIKRAAACAGKRVAPWARAALLKVLQSSGARRLDLDLIEARLAWIGSVLQARLDGRGAPRISGPDRVQAGEVLGELRLLLAELSSRRHGLGEGAA